MNAILSSWYFHIPNFILAALMYTVLGRLILSVFVAPNWNNYIWNFFVRLTDPVVSMTRTITPKSVAPVIVLVFSFLWLMLARMVWFAIIGAAGLLPQMGP